MKSQIILGIETSCDETAAAVLEKQGNQITILSHIVASSASLQAKYGGIIPEQAAREQIKSIIPVIEEALVQAFPHHPISDIRHLISELDAIAVTQGPGLIGSLLVGVETAKTLALIWNKPLIPVNHLMGHFYANFITDVSRGDSNEGSRRMPTAIARTSDGKHRWQDPKKQTPIFPCVGLLVSGGHTDLILLKSHQEYIYLGGTRDDAAGECFDKCARILGLPYPGGPEISKLAQKGNPKAFKLPRPMISSDNFDFSFSGLKTAVANLVNTKSGGMKSDELNNLCASIEQAIIDSLIKKAIVAAQIYHVEQIIIAGGVAANQKLTSDLKLKISKACLSKRGKVENLKLKIQLLVPPPHLCTDNAAMIASRAFFDSPIKNPLNLQANPNLSLSD